MFARVHILIVSPALLSASVLLAAVQPDSVKIETDIAGRVFKWRITNNSAPPITRLKVPVYSVYDHTAPEGWEFDKVSKHTFIATATSPAHAIFIDGTKEFSVRAISSGAVLTTGTVVVGFEKGDPLEVHGVWIPQVESVWSVLISPLVLIGIIAGHILLTRRRKPSPEAG